MTHVMQAWNAREDNQKPTTFPDRSLTTDKSVQQGTTRQQYFQGCVWQFLMRSRAK